MHYSLLLKKSSVHLCMLYGVCVFSFICKCEDRNLYLGICGGQMTTLGFDSPSTSVVLLFVAVSARRAGQGASGNSSVFASHLSEEVLRLRIPSQDVHGFWGLKLRAHAYS